MRAWNVGEVDSYELFTLFVHTSLRYASQLAHFLPTQ